LQILLRDPETLPITPVKFRFTHRSQPNSPPPISLSESKRSRCQYYWHNPRTPPAHPIPLIQTERPYCYKKNSDALEDQAAKFESVLKALRISLQQDNISPTQYADKVNTIIVSALQVTDDRVLGKTEFSGKSPKKNT